MVSNDDRRHHAISLRLDKSCSKQLNTTRHFPKTSKTVKRVKFRVCFGKQLIILKNMYKHKIQSTFLTVHITLKLK